MAQSVDPPDYTPLGIGPPDPMSGDPAWIEPQHYPGGNIPGDFYFARGRSMQRVPPTAMHPADANHLMIGRIGLLKAWQRLHEALLVVEDLKPEGELPRGNPHEDPVALAIVALFEAMEWIHSIDEHLRLDGRYRAATDIDPSAGSFVLGILGARNASHHGLRRLIGLARVPTTGYIASAARWELLDWSAAADTAAIGAPDDSGPVSRTFLSVRWREDIPDRIEIGVRDRDRRLRYEDQRRAYLEALAGRDVRSTFAEAAAFVLYTINGQAAPDFSTSPARNPPDIAGASI